MKTRRDSARRWTKADAPFGVGVLLIVAGVAWIWPPLGLVSAGLALVGLAVVAEYRSQAESRPSTSARAAGRNRGRRRRTNVIRATQRRGASNDR